MPSGYAYQAIEQALADNDLLDTAYLIGSNAAKQHFGERVKQSIDGASLRAAVERGEKVAARYFLFGIAAQFDEPIVRFSQEHGVDVVPAVNTFRYEGPDAAEQAEADVRRLRAMGVQRFQIDSVYEPLFAVPR